MVYVKTGQKQILIIGLTSEEALEHNIFLQSPLQACM